MSEDLSHGDVGVHFDGGGAFFSYDTDRPPGCHITCDRGELDGCFNPNSYNWISNLCTGCSEPLCARVCPTLCPDGALPCVFLDGETDWDWKANCDIGKDYVNLLRQVELVSGQLDEASEGVCRDVMEDRSHGNIGVHFACGDAFSFYALDKTTGCHITCKGGALIGGFEANSYNRINNLGMGGSEPLCARV